MNTLNNLVWHHATVTRQRRADLNQHQSTVLWFTGLSGAGKSTLAHALEERLYQMRFHTFVLDGDNVRHNLCKDLGFSADARVENIRRVAEVAKLFVEAGVIVLTAFISPFAEDRAKARQLLGDDFIEIYCDCSLEICEQRDVKGLYRRARAGEVKDFTGISSPYEIPEQPDLRVDTGSQDLESCVTQVLDYLVQRGVYQLK
ncbi:MAG: adenylyl-sulfate kinase [Thiotrichaceae bacterium]|nr:adenylyl-sulfate kinase [Thiotrichaceae bacterium]